MKATLFEKPIIFTAIAFIGLFVFAFSYNPADKLEDQQIEEFDKKIEKLKSEIGDLNKNSHQRAVTLDSLLQTI